MEYSVSNIPGLLWVEWGDIMPHFSGLQCILTEISVNMIIMGANVRINAMLNKDSQEVMISRRQVRYWGNTIYLISINNWNCHEVQWGAGVYCDCWCPGAKAPGHQHRNTDQILLVTNEFHKICLFCNWIHFTFQINWKICPDYLQIDG